MNGVISVLSLHV